MTGSIRYGNKEIVRVVFISAAAGTFVEMEMFCQVTVNK